MKVLKTIIVLLVVLFAKTGFALNIDIRVYSDYNLSKVLFVPISGVYMIEIDGLNTLELYRNSTLTIEVIGDSLQLTKDGQKLQKAKSLKLYGRGFLNAFSIGSDILGIPKRDYDDNLFITANRNKLMLFNNIELERYVAGVVQSEGGGSSKNIEFFFVQAITCRTYALANIMKHKVDKHNLCDGVHCQLYTGRCKNADIVLAVSRTAGDVIVDQNKHLISAAFHSNCGGQTANSEDVWSIPTSYLKSVKDTFCTQARGATWTRHFSTNDWLALLQKNYNYPIQDTSLRNKAIDFIQTDRKKYFSNAILLKDMRRDLFLRSSYFDVKNDGDSIVLIGRGYGHGVGLCQQGAINMVEKGMSYKEVISFYYSKTSIINYKELGYSFLVD